MSYSSNLIEIDLSCFIFSSYIYLSFLISSCFPSNFVFFFILLYIYIYLNFVRKSTIVLLTICITHTNYCNNIIFKGFLFLTHYKNETCFKCLGISLPHQQCSYEYFSSTLGANYSAFNSLIWFHTLLYPKGSLEIIDRLFNLPMHK